MSKKTNTLWFVLGATVFNILITMAAFLILLLLYVRFLLPLIPEGYGAWAFPLIFIGAIVTSFAVYRIVLKQIMKRVDMEKYFDPIFNSRRPSGR